MAANTLPSGINDLFSLARRMGDGLARHGVWLLNGFSTAEKLRGLLSAAREAEREFAVARGAKAAAGNRAAAADDELTSWLAKARLVVMLALGSQWSESWVAAGFTHRGTNVPKRVALRMELGSRLVDFFAAHPEYEVPFARVTAAHGRSLVKATAAAQEKMERTKAAATAKKRVRDAAEKNLRREMSGVVGVLPCVLGKSDPRWLEFGLKQPRPEGSQDRRQAPAPEPVAADFQRSGQQPATGGENALAA